jgi:hypothetical protein
MCMPKPAKSSESFYQEIKPSFGELPSLRTASKASDRKGPQYKKVEPRKGKATRSLLYPTGGE